MLENIQAILRHTIVIQDEMERYASGELTLISKNPEHLFQARIVCADGFFVPVAVNKDNRGITDLPIPGEVEMLHARYHDAVGYENCKGMSYIYIF